jgi:hypothetical protein
MWADFRIAMDVIRSGWAMSLGDASQAALTMG